MKFTGHERDLGGVGGEDDLDYMHARHYSPYLCRFLAMDPAAQSVTLGLPQSWNKYAYVGNNPINRVDPDGRLAFLATVLVGGLTDAGFQVAINAISGEPLSAGVGKAFVTGAVIGATGVGVVKLVGKGVKLAKAAKKAGKAKKAAAAAADSAQALPRSGPIAKSLGAMSKAEQVARKLRLNANSPTTRQALNSLDDTVESFVGQFRKGGIRREDA